MDISRRKAILAASAFGLDAILETCDLGLVGNGVNLADYARRRASYPTTEQVAELFQEKGIHPEVRQAEGERTIIVLGDISHFGFGSSYVEFASNVKRKFRLSRIFMEGVYEKPHCDDPHLEYFRNQDPSFKGSKDEADYIRRDLQGYFRLKKENIVNGIEDRELSLDYNALNKIGDIFLDFMFTYQMDVDEVYRLYNSLQNKSFKLGNLRQMNIEQKINLQKKVSEESDNLFVLKRNSQFVQAIDRQLRDYELGMLVVGEGHISLDRHSARPEHLGNYNLLFDLAKAGIGSVYLNCFDFTKFNALVARDNS